MSDELEKRIADVEMANDILARDFQSRLKKLEDANDNMKLELLERIGDLEEELLERVRDLEEEHPLSFEDIS